MILEKKDLDMPLNNTPFVAIYMITYNHANFIAKAIESVMMQQSDFEYKLFIGEDCSTDGTREICQSLKEKYPGKIELFAHEKNIGVHENAKQIFAASFGSGAKYIALLEGDDYWTDPLKLQKQVDFLENNPEYVLTFHQVDILNQRNEITADFLTKVPENYETIETFARLGNYIHTPSVVFRNCIAELPFEFKYCPIGDYFLYLILAEHGNLKYIEEKMAVYRYGVGIFSGKSALHLAKNNVKLFSCVLSYLQDEKIKKIIFDRYLEALAALDKSISNQYKDHFISNHAFFRAWGFVGKNLKQPQVILGKLKQKIFKP
jgi:glycosyltransferase involved in cell wall biosynthesis